MDSSKPIVYYDIASGPPVRTFAPNPWKTRYVLNFKKANYKTSWVDYPDVTSTRKKLGVAPNRTLPDGSDFYTLPVIHDEATGDVVGDSFEIAEYLDEKYPDPNTLLVPPSTRGLILALNAQVDKIFTDNILLFVHGQPFAPELMPKVVEIFESRFPGMTFEMMGVKGDARISLFEKLKADISVLTRAWKVNDKGPFLEGEKPMYADIILGAWLQYSRECCSAEEWNDIRSWHDGLWAKVHDGLAAYCEMK